MKDNIYWFGPDDDWGELYKTEEGRFLPDNMYADYIREKEEQKQRVESLINVQKWTRTDFDTINTLLNKYKETNDELIFNELYERYFNKLINGCIKKYFKTLPIKIINHYFYDKNEFYDLCYRILLGAINSWKFNRENNTRDFAYFYIRRIIYAKKDILRNYKNLKSKNIYIYTIDFNDDNMVKLANKHTHLNKSTDFDLINENIDLKNKLNDKEMLVLTLINNKVSKSDIAKELNTSRSQVDRIIKKILGLII